MLKRRRSAILTIGSGIRAIPAPGLNLYSSTKQFLYYLTKSMAYELKDSNLDLLCYEPGGVDTKMT